MLLHQCQQGIIAHAAQRGTCMNVTAHTNPSTSEINSQYGMLLDNELQQEWFLSPATGISITGNSALLLVLLGEEFALGQCGTCRRQWHWQ